MAITGRMMSPPTYTTDDYTEQQNFNEAVIKMMVLLYQVNGKVTLTELAFFDETIDAFDWRNGISLAAFVNQVIYEVRQAIDRSEATRYLKSLGQALNYDSVKALDLAMKLTALKGQRSDEEKELLDVLSNKILAKGLVA